MRQPRYHDFEVQIDAAGDGSGYRAAVLSSPRGQASAPLRWPFDPATLDQRLAELEDALLGRTGEDPAPLARRLGTQLFEALIQGEVRDLYYSSLDGAREKGQGLRLELRINVPELAVVPWEYLYDPRQGDYVALSRYTPIVRYPELPLPDQELAVTGTLRILGMVASPADLDPLDVEREKARLQDAVHELRENGAVELTWTEGGTARDLQAALQRGPWHIFHFLGHAAYDDGVGEGVLLLEGDAGRSAPLGATQLARLLANQPTLRLALLNACEGARGQGGGLFTSTAAALARRGLPAVLAMQYAISDRAAIEFMTSFYQGLATNLPIDAAVSEARQAVALATSESMEWGIPVLYMRAADGIIWRVGSEGRDMRTEEGQNWWDNLPDALGGFSAGEIGGDVTVATVGDHAQNVAIGKNITQIIHEALGEPTPDDAQAIEQEFARVTATLQALQGQIDAVTLVRAQDRLPLLEGELTKVEGSETPSGKTIMTIGDWLLDNVPDIVEALASLFATPAVGKVVGKAGEATVNWVRQRFGDQHGAHKGL